MGNTLLTPTAITRESLRVLHSNLAFVKSIDKQHDNKVEFGGQKAGGSIQIRKPVQYSVRTGATIDIQDSTETYTTLTVGTQKGVDMGFSSTDLTLSIDDFSSRFIKPAMSRLAAAIDVDAWSMYQSVWNHVGTPATTPATALVALQAGQKLTENLADREGRKMIVTPETEAAMVNGLSGLFNSQQEVSKQYMTGYMGNALGFDWACSQTTPSLTTGTRVGTVLVDGAVATEGSTTIHMDGFTNAADTIKKGEVFTVAGVYAINPETKQTLSHLQQFVVTADFTAASNEGDVSVSPAMYTSASGGLQSVSAFPANDAAIVFVNTTASTVYGQNMAFHPEAFTFATANLIMPSGVDFAAREVMDGISLRIVRDYDINNDNFPTRIDVLYGYVAQRPEWACRMTD